jgi:regulatory protein
MSSTSKKRTPLTARNKMMDFIASRDHSEKELRRKLKKYEFSTEEIDRALEFAREHDWIPSNQDENLKLSEKMARGLHRRNKGIVYINHFLQEKGLPRLSPDHELEVEKARRSLENKKPRDKSGDPKKEKLKLSRFLAARGFQMEVIRKVLK